MFTGNNHDFDEGDLDDKIETMKSFYDHAKASKVGALIVCVSCEKFFRKKVYQQAFCKPRCKDYFWNVTDEKRRERAALFN